MYIFLAQLISATGKKKPRKYTMGANIRVGVIQIARAIFGATLEVIQGSYYVT